MLLEMWLSLWTVLPKLCNRCASYENIYFHKFFLVKYTTCALLVLLLSNYFIIIASTSFRVINLWSVWITNNSRYSVMSSRTLLSRKMNHGTFVENCYFEETSSIIYIQTVPRVCCNGMYSIKKTWILKYYTEFLF